MWVENEDQRDDERGHGEEGVSEPRPAQFQD